MNNESLLWTQGINNKGLFCSNREIVASGDTSYTNLLNRFSELVKTYKWDYRDECVKTFYDGRRTIVSGYYDEKDNTGRRVTYTFYNSGDPNLAVIELEKLSNAIHYTIPSGVLRDISTALQAKADRIKKCKRMLVVSSVVLFVIVTILIIIIK